jgi:2-hydroxy-3-keto-5-methylthiopentenyl-1-phosphate phosphatase
MNALKDFYDKTPKVKSDYVEENGKHYLIYQITNILEKTTAGTIEIGIAKINFKVDPGHTVTYKVEVPKNWTSLREKTTFTAPKEINGWTESCN